MEKGVLSNIDILRAIGKDPPLIQNSPPDGDRLKGILQPAAYDLRVGHIITAREYVHYDGGEGRDIRGRRKDTVLLKPGESATIATLERLNLPDDINAIIVARDSYAKKGLLTLNAGHIDPGHNGFVTAQVVNLTDRPFPIHLEVSYFSIVFSVLTSKAVSDLTRKAGPRPRQLESDNERLLEYRFAAAQAPASLVQKETLEEVFVSHDDLTFELLKRLWVLLLGLAALGGLGVGIWQAVEALRP